ncbi:MAG TPA: hypothetical protein VGC91_05900 [Pyrinomonadaceae bacterium]
MRNAKKIMRACLALSFLLAGMNINSFSQQQADQTFDASVAHPAYTTTHPKVLLDEAHNNFHTASGRYKPFADLVGNDGYVVTPNKEKFRKESLQGYDILVIANALGNSNMDAPDADKPAFTEEECDVVREWVREGGALLLVADHAPAGGAAANLGSRFGVDMSKAYVADPLNFERIMFDVSWIRYSRENKNLGDHPITRGRERSELINGVVSFTGQSLKGPAGSTELLKLSNAAFDVIDPGNPQKAKTMSAAGRAQAIAMPFGKGRVVVFGEAAMLSAQNTNFGMNYPGTDNRQLVLNVMHWLSGLLK